jgi:hypothetical protein
MRTITEKKKKWIGQGFYLYCWNSFDGVEEVQGQISQPRQAIFWSLIWCPVGRHLLISKAPWFYVCWSLFYCHLCMVASGVLPSGDTPLLSLCFGMHGIMAMLFHLVSLYAHLSMPLIGIITYTTPTPFCSIEVLISWSWYILNLRGICLCTLWESMWDSDSPLSKLYY